MVPFGVMALGDLCFYIFENISFYALDGEAAFLHQLSFAAFTLLLRHSVLFAQAAEAEYAAALAEIELFKERALEGQRVRGCRRL